MNANAELNAENSTPIEELNALIFDLGDTIPEGIYLKLMNNTKKIYDDIKKAEKYINMNNGISLSIQQKVNHIINIEDKIYRLRRMVRGVEEGQTVIKVYEENNLFMTQRILSIGSLVRIFINGDKYKFMRLNKINEKSIIYDVICVNSYDDVRINRNCKLKIREGEYLVNLVSKNISFYETPNATVNALYSRLTHNIPETDFMNDTGLSLRQNF